MLDHSWQKVLKSESNQPYWIKLMDWLDHAYKEQEVLPVRENLFQAFRLTPYEQVKVIVLGQDPYPGTDPQGVPHAHGLAFSSQSTCQIPASLKNIYKELAQDLQVSPPDKADLSPWAEQGVLLLNTVLTVQAGKSNSHRKKGWEIFTDHLIELLGKDPFPRIFWLWGNPAKAKQPLIKGKKKLILTAAHPSPLSAYKGFFGSRPFSQTNQFLQQQGLEPIKWV